MLPQRAFRVLPQRVLPSKVILLGDFRGAAPKRILGAAPKRISGAAPKRILGAAPKMILGAAPKRILGGCPKDLWGSLWGALWGRPLGHPSGNPPGGEVGSWDPIGPQSTTRDSSYEAWHAFLKANDITRPQTWLMFRKNMQYAPGNRYRCCDEARSYET